MRCLIFIPLYGVHLYLSVLARRIIARQIVEFRHNQSPKMIGVILLTTGDIVLLIFTDKC